MTKSQIITEYNSLTSTINNEVTNYRTITGRDWKGSPRLGSMGGSYMSLSKDELERLLLMRRSSIYSIREAIENWKRTEEILSTEEGKNFVQGLMDELEMRKNEITKTRDEITKKFNDTLNKIGLDWSVAYGLIGPSYYGCCFDIHMNGKHNWCRLSIHIEKKSSKWVMEVNSATSGSSDIFARDDQYERFKAYVTICDNAPEFQEFMDHEFHAATARVHDLLERVDELKEMIVSPADYYRA